MSLAGRAALALALAVSCAEPPPVKRDPSVAQWQDVLEGVPDIYAVLRPRALRRDPLYGSLWTSLVRVAQSKHLLSGSSMLEAVESSEELVLGIGKSADAVLVLRGVSASLDPARLVDADGKTWFSARDERARVVEYEIVQRDLAGQGALFRLPDRTWVAAVGPAKDRARHAYGHPLNRPVPKTEADALATVYLGGPAAQLLSGNAALHDLLDRVTRIGFTLKPEKAGLVVALTYDEPSRTAFAEMEAKRLVERLGKEEKTSWVKGAAVAYEGNTVFIRLAVPPRLLEELPRASGADLGL